METASITTKKSSDDIKDLIAKLQSVGSKALEYKLKSCKIKLKDGVKTILMTDRFVLKDLIQELKTLPETCIVKDFKIVCDTEHHFVIIKK